ncbi:hypothetical protein EPO34_01035 [Patescibacteria group bacterium]|nr:MAG: hypothetical protein EPO34_01035 [Patescibacteria group bacterium]
MADKKSPSVSFGDVLGVVALAIVLFVVVGKGCFPDTARAATMTEQATASAPARVPMQWHNMFYSVSAYSPSEDETDSTPCESADGTNPCELYALYVATDGEEGELTCAQNELPFGTPMDIPGYGPEHLQENGFGRCVVHDRMNERFNGKYHLDVFFPTKEEALKWGRQTRRAVYWTPVSSDDGTGWACPTEEQEMTSGWGMRKLKQRKHAKFHLGMDLEADAGDKTFAVTAGKVTHAGSFGDCGQTIDVTHDDGVMTRYCHHASLTVQDGQRVERGQQIGIAGRSGNAQGIHLHFEVLKGGTRVNPEELLPRRCWDPGGERIAKN